MNIDNGKTPRVIFGPACDPTLVTSFCEKMSELLNLPFAGVEYKYTKFLDGEIKVRINESVRDAAVYVIQPTQPPFDNFWTMKLLCNAAANASVKRLTAIPTYLVGLRQDRKDEPRVPLTAKMAVKELEASMCPAPRKHIIGVTPHFSQWVDIVDDATTDTIFPTKQLVDAFLAFVLNNIENLRTAAADVGGTKIANIYRNLLKLSEMAIGLKDRDDDDHVVYRGIVGDVKDKNALICEDIVDSAGTLCAYVEELEEFGALDIFAAAPHGIFAGPAFDRLIAAKAHGLKKVFVTNTVNVFANLEQRTTCDLAEVRDLIEVVDIGPFLAQVVYNTHTGRSISAIDGIFSKR